MNFGHRRAADKSSRVQARMRGQAGSTLNEKAPHSRDALSMSYGPAARADRLYFLLKAERQLEQGI